MNNMIDDAKKCYIKEQLHTADIKTVFRTVNGLLNSNNKTLPSHDSPQCLSDEFAQYYKDKVKKIYDGLEREQCNVNSSCISNMCNPRSVPRTMSDFDLLSEEEVMKLVKRFAAKSCLLDPIPTWYVKNNLPTFVPGITKILNVSLSTGVFPDHLKHAIINPIIKKPSLDPNELKNYRPVSNIKFLSKVIEKHVVNNITNHMLEHGLGEPLQSAYRVAHSTETALVKG